MISLKELDKISAGDAKVRSSSAGECPATQEGSEPFFVGIVKAILGECL
jgi:hypothetical protein